VKWEKINCLIIALIHSVNACESIHVDNQTTKMCPLILFVLAFDNGERELCPNVIVPRSTTQYLPSQIPVLWRKAHFDGTLQAYNAMSLEVSCFEDC